MAVYTAIDDPEAYFQTVLYTGDTSAQSITLPGDTNMQPDMVWIKVRSASAYGVIQDSVRGVTGTDSYNIITTAASTDVSDAITALNSDGFTVGTDANDRSNYDSQTHVAWCWKETATAGFDIVSYTGSGSARTISHSLSAVPKMFIIKNKSASSGDTGWGVYHVSNGNTHFLELNLNAAKDESSGLFNDTTPTSSVFSVGDNSRVNTNTETYIAYLFEEKQGFSKFGSFVGNGSLNGTFCYTGFRPAFVMLKCSSHASSNWVMLDNKRSNPFNDATCPDALYANDNATESTASPWADLLSNGFKCRGYNEGNTINASTSHTYIYMAFAEAPFVNSNGVPCNAR